MKKRLIFLFAILLLVFIICPTTMAGSVYKVTLDVNFVGNLIFSTYDVDVYLNDLQLETLPHGVGYKGVFYAEEGFSTLHFYNHENKDVNGEISIEVKEDTVVKCSISCYSDKVSVYDVRIETDTPAAIEEAVQQEPVATVEPGIEQIIPEQSLEPVITEAPMLEPTLEPVITEVPTIEPTSEPVATEVLLPQIVSFADIDLGSMTDEELASALAAIKEEQRSRIKTKVILDKTNVAISVGKTEKVTAEIVDIPEGEMAPELVWSVSDSSIAICTNGTIKGVRNGSTIVTCSGTLRDGTVVYEECAVQVIIPIVSITVNPKTINLNGGETATPKFTFKPDNASLTRLEFESNKPEVATVNDQGVIEGTGNGLAVITAKATDGSGKSAIINVKVVDKRIKKETARKAVMTVICNDRSMDVFAADGIHYDKRKLHDYSYYPNVYTVVNDGEWKTDDGGNTWHVDHFLIQNESGGYFRYSFDIRFDGKNYICENGFVDSSRKLEWLNSKSDSSKYDEYTLEDLSSNIFCIVSPKQIGE